MLVGAPQLRRLITAGLAVLMMVLALVSFVPSASAAPEASTSSLCWYREWFGGKHYCPATTRGVLATKYGVGRRVHLDKLLLAAEYDDYLVFEAPDCDTCPGSVYLNVPWKGPHRPVNDNSGPYTRRSFRIYGTTTVGSLQPTGYVTTGYCYWEPACGD